MLVRFPQPWRAALNPLRVAIGGWQEDVHRLRVVDPSTRFLRMLKVFDAPADPSRSIIEAIGKITAAQTSFFTGTTIGTNAARTQRR
jgi:hypothetical protein